MLMQQKVGYTVKIKVNEQEAILLQQQVEQLQLQEIIKFILLQVLELLVFNQQ